MDRAGHLMGYPMTYQRVVGRNRLGEGDYNNVSAFPWHASGTAVAWSNVTDFESLARSLERNWNESAEKFNQRVSLLFGDLRRLERDTVDESATCQYIAQRTGVDADVVAVVLKEFMSW